MGGRSTASTEPFCVIFTCNAYAYVRAHKSLPVALAINNNWPWFIGKKLPAVNRAVRADNDLFYCFLRNLYRRNEGIKTGRKPSTFLKCGHYYESGFTCGEGLLACLTSSSQNVKESKSCDKPLLFRQDRSRMVGMFAAFLQLFYPLVSANHMLSLQKDFFFNTVCLGWRSESSPCKLE